MQIFSKLQNGLVTLSLCVIALIVGYYLGENGYELKKLDFKEVKIENKNPDLPTSVDFKRFWEVWDMLNKEHVRRPLNAEKLLDGAIHGMVNSVEDPYTVYLNIEENSEALGSLNGKYEGIGAQLGFDDKTRLIIQAPLDDSPAEKAGVRSGDLILKIDGTDTNGITIDEAVNKIRGEAGTVVTLNMYREGWDEPSDIKITRANINIESVKWEDKGDDIAYVRLSRFGEDTNSEWTKNMTEIASKMPNLKSMIIDLRNNPGGYLDSSVYTSSEFISSGVVVTEDFLIGEKNEFEVKRKGLFTDNKIKLVVLIDQGSASAAEIMAGALKERVNAVLVGKRSFGKGSVQKPGEFADGASLHVTVAKWLTPNGNWLDKHNSSFKDSEYNEVDESGKEIIGGIKPDHIVEVTEDDITNSRDPQLDKAIEILKQ